MLHITTKKIVILIIIAIAGLLLSSCGRNTKQVRVKQLVRSSLTKEFVPLSTIELMNVDSAYRVGDTLSDIGLMYVIIP